MIIATPMNNRMTFILSVHYFSLYSVILTINVDCFMAYALYLCPIQPFALAFEFK